MARQCETLLDIDEIQARDIRLLEKNFENLNLEVRDLKQINQATQFRLDEEVLQKVTALERVQELEDHVNELNVRLTGEQQVNEQASHILASVQNLLRASDSEVSDTADIIEVLLQKMGNTHDGHGILQSTERKSLKEKVLLLDVFFLATHSTISSLRDRVNLLESNLNASDKAFHLAVLQRDDMIDGLSRWESTCSLLEELYVEQVKLQHERITTMQTRIKLLECLAQEQEQKQRNSDEKCDSLCHNLQSLHSELDSCKRQSENLLSEVLHHHITPSASSSNDFIYAGIEFPERLSQRGSHGATNFGAA